jgi:hypothetical protein
MPAVAWSGSEAGVGDLAAVNAEMEAEGMWVMGVETVAARMAKQMVEEARAGTREAD